MVECMVVCMVVCMFVIALLFLKVQVTRFWPS